MVKITLAVAAAAAMLTTVPLVTPAKAQGVKIAQGVDVQVGRDRDYDWGREYDRDRGRRYDSDTTVGVGPGGVTVGPRQRCRTVTTRVERDDGRMITRRVRVPMKPAMHSNSKPAGYSNRKPATLGVNRMGRFDDVVGG
jgi:hypothetical protein